MVSVTFGSVFASNFGCSLVGAGLTLEGSDLVSACLSDELPTVTTGLSSAFFSSVFTVDLSYVEGDSLLAAEAATAYTLESLAGPAASDAGFVESAFAS